jgi:ubiquinone/menaquinone biosynthesis C-methylase UbiE
MRSNSDLNLNSKILESLELITKWAATSDSRKVATAAALFDHLDHLATQTPSADWETSLPDLIKERATPISTAMEKSDHISLNFNENSDQDSIAEVTGNTYFKLWKDFTEVEYHDEATRLLKIRLERNGITLNSFSRALDAGCGSGRYSMALRELGVSRVLGLDASHDSVAFAQKINRFPSSEVEFIQGSVLELPYPDDSIDLVFSNGVLHHTTDPSLGISEIRRVLKPGGCCWLYLYGGKDSLFWDVVDLCRKLLANVPQLRAQALMKAAGYSSGRIFHRLDFWYVPIQERYYQNEVEEMLKKEGFSNFRRLTRGADHDWDEIIYRKEVKIPYSFYGEGEMRYWIAG